MTLTQRGADLLSALFFIILSLVLRSQLEDVPVEGALFPLWTLNLIIAASLFLALRAFMKKENKPVSFFGEIPPLRWLGVIALFFIQVFCAMTISFLWSMGIGMFIMLLFLAPVKNFKTVLADFLFAAGLLLFFELFFTNVMRIYFPEYL